MQNLQLNALFGFYLAANSDDDVFCGSPESQDYLASPLWKRKNWVHALQLRMMCLVFLTAAVLSKQSLRNKLPFWELKGVSCRDASCWEMIHRLIFLILFSSPLKVMMFILVSHVSSFALNCLLSCLEAFRKLQMQNLPHSLTSYLVLQLWYSEVLN